MSDPHVHVRAPATTANLGPGFDCAGAALDLWNELEVWPGDEPADRSHLGVRAFERLVPATGWSFRFVDRIPQARGLGSSAAVVALGLVAAAIVGKLEPTADELLALGIELEGHGDNLAAALTGGVCLTWGTRIARIADTAPATPIAVIPEHRVETAASRAALPANVPHADAAFSAGRAAMLGAALASNSADLFEAALEDRLHEPYRAESSPVLAQVRSLPPAGALGSTLSGAGPSVIVWARNDQAEACAAELRQRFPQEQILPLTISPTGAAAT
ncbi:MAG: homoserine kinase [Gaiellaceae bacterium]|nr:homoserine kinase [Gaiellaceae bacterium]